MDSINTKEIYIPKKIANKWQKTVNIMAELTGVTACLIRKVNPPYMEVFRSSKSEDNPYNVGDKEELSGPYCEEVIKTDNKLLVSNALNDDGRKNNSDLELGMISYLGFPIKWPDGDFFGTICILDARENKFTDKTEDLLKQFKELIELYLRNIYDRQKLEKSEGKLRTILHSIGDGVITTDENGCIDIMNSTAEKITGYKLKQVKGNKLEDIFELVNSLSRESVYFPVEKVLATGKTFYLPEDTILIDKRGKKYKIADSIAPIQEDEEKIQGIVLVFSNTSRDNLTGLYNSSYMEEKIKELDNKEQLPLSIIMVDINGLKLVNNGKSHKTGDKLLIKTAEILLSCTAKEDFVARWGGDEFIILLPRTKEKEASKICRDITEKSQKTKLDDISLSLGIGTVTKIEAEQDIYEILHRIEDKVLIDKLTRKKSAKHKLLQNMLETLGAKSNESKEHAQRMNRLSSKMGEKIGLSREELNHLSLLSILHDIGKVNIAEEILKKPSDLTDLEWETIKKHPEKGFAIAMAIKEFAPVADSILAHHERWNGEGYPQGLKEEEIPLLARILSIVDAYDVMINGRPYQEPKSEREAIEEIKKCAGSQFDPELAHKFVEIMS